MSLPAGVSYVGDRAFADCYWLDTVLFPDRRMTVGKAIFAGCAGLSTIVICDRLRIRWRRRDRWRVPEETRVIYHSQLQLSELWLELGRCEEERREVLLREVARLQRVLRRRRLLPDEAAPQ